MIQYKHIVSKCFSFRIDCWLITDNVHSNAVYNHNHGAIGIVWSNDYQDVLFLTWKFHYSSAIRSVVIKTFTESRMELEISSSPLKHTYPNLAKAWATLLYSIHLNKQIKRKKSQKLATSVLAPALLQVLHRTPLLPTLAGVWAHWSPGLVY